MYLNIFISRILFNLKSLYNKIFFLGFGESFGGQEGIITVWKYAFL